MKQEDITIQRKKGHYIIRKGNISYGSYETLEDLTFIIKKMDEYNWDVEKLRKYQYKTDLYKNKYIKIFKTKERKYKIIKKDVVYGIFEDIDNAREYRDFLVRKNWNVDVDHIRKVNDKYEVYDDWQLFATCDDINDAKYKRDLLFKE